MASRDPEDWITCSDCEAEFKIITLEADPPCFCPCCGTALPEEEVEPEEEE